MAIQSTHAETLTAREIRDLLMCLSDEKRQALLDLLGPCDGALLVNDALLALRDLKGWYDSI